MNRLTIIGNLTKDPVMRTTQTGQNVCSFTVAVNKPKRNGQDQGADYFNVSAWNKQAENCATYLAKGRKVAVVGPVSVHTYQGNDGKTYAQMDVMANEVEFLTPKGEVMTQMADAAVGGGAPVAQEEFIPVETDDLPF